VKKKSKKWNFLIRKKQQQQQQQVFDKSWYQKWVVKNHPPFLQDQIESA
jgi:hypothetical protein